MEFVNAMSEFYSEKTLPTDIVIDLDKVATFLEMERFNIKKTLLASYKLGIDFTISKYEKQSGVKKHGAHLKELILVTPDCFKRLCMRSKTVNGERVRSYFLRIESIIIEYRNILINHLETKLQSAEAKIKVLEYNQRPIAKTDNGEEQGGIVYVFSVEKGMFRIGSTNNEIKRMKEHGSSHADDIQPAAVFKVKNYKAAEKCALAYMADKRYLRKKDVFDADLDMVKAVITACIEPGVIMKKKEKTMYDRHS